MANVDKSVHKEGLILQLELEKSKLNREKSLLLLDKALLLYFAFLIIGVVGFINKYINAKYLNIMIVLSFGVLGIGLIPYMLTMSREEKRLNELVKPLKNKQNVEPRKAKVHKVSREKSGWQAIEKALK